MSTSPGEYRDVAPETIQRLKENAKSVKNWLTNLGIGGEYLNPMYQKEWLANGIPALALRILSDLEQGALGSILAEELESIRFGGGSIFVGFFRNPQDRIYSESQACFIYPKATQLDKDINEAFGLE